MDRLTDEARLADLNQGARADEQRRRAQVERLAPAIDQARRLLPRLAGLFTALAGQTRTEAAAQAWVDTWARLIYSKQLNDSELARGLGGIDEVMRNAGNPPFSFPLFLQACRPSGHKTGLDSEAHQKNERALVRCDYSKIESWRAARATAFSKLQALGHCKK